MVTIYIDTADIPKGKQRYCHMAVALGADLNHLHAFADLIGLKRCWFENKPAHPHYDINAVLKAKAMKLHGSTIVVNGVTMPLSVIEISPFEFVDRCTKRISAPKNSVATMFGGGEGVGVGAKMAGLIHLWGIEKDPKIADVARMNGYYMITADVCDVDYSTLAKPWWLHASPPCINASVAKANKGETELDGLLADAIIRAISDLLPERFSLENVRGYKEFTCYGRIKKHLTSLGYAFVESILNAADYGTPQTRERLFLIASRTSTPRIPMPTHYDARGGNMNMFAQPWIGWYQSIADLVDDLEPTEFAPWQIERLPKELLATTLIDTTATRKATVRDADEPSYTVTATAMRRPSQEPKAILINSVNAGQTYSSGTRSAAMPAMTMCTQSKPKALLIGNAGYDGGIVSRETVDPSFTIPANENQGQLKAFIADGQPGSMGTKMTTRIDSEHGFTIQASAEKKPLRAFIAGGGNTNTSEDRDRPVRWQDDPAYTVTGSSDRDRASVAGRVVRISTRCLARFNGLPDTYQLPEKKGLACMVVGNMVMPLVMKAVIEANR